MDKPEIASPPSECQSNNYHDTILNQLDSLSLTSKKYSDIQTVSQNGGTKYVQKSKNIQKLKNKQLNRTQQGYAKASLKRKNTMKKTKVLQNRIIQLQRQISSLRRMCENCPNCHPEILCCGMIPNDVEMVKHEQLLKITRDQDHKNSRQSIQFEAIDFSQTLACKPQMDDRAWIMIGVMMIAMGSKNIDIDGTINTFKVLNDCVDSVRRQVEKCQSKIGLDFYLLRQEMKEHGNYIEGLDFDPFYSKVQKSGFQLQGLKIQNSQMFELVYDQKINFSINYDSLIATVEHLKQNCWISSG